MQRSHYLVVALAAMVSLLSACGLTPFSDSAVANKQADTSKAAIGQQVVNITTAPVQDSAEGWSLNPYYQATRMGANGEQLHTNRTGVYRGQALTKHIGDYVQNMTQDLISNMDYLTDKTPVGVSHFALLDSDLQQTNLLGHQLAESFLHELHKFRIPVIDYKATDYIRVTEQGDFLLSRDFLELENRVNVDYILTGTLARHQGGYLVNARILGLKTKVVVASAQMLVPFYVVDALLPSQQDMVDGVQLINGD